MAYCPLSRANAQVDDDEKNIRCDWTEGDEPDQCWRARCSCTGLAGYDAHVSNLCCTGERRMMFFQPRALSEARSPSSSAAFRSTVSTAVLRKESHDQAQRAHARGL